VDIRIKISFSINTKILSVATQFAASICEVKGAIPSSKQFYEKLAHLIKEKNSSK
jgi:hypothetical protein